MRPAVKSRWWRGSGTLAAAVIPAIVVRFTAESVGDAVTASLKAESARRLHNGEDLATVMALSSPEVLAGAILLVYLAWGAAVAAIGSGMRAYAHNEDERKGLDLAGKLLAISATSIVAVGGFMRLSAARDAELSLYTSGVVVGLGVVLIGLSLWVGGRVKIYDFEAKQAKEDARENRVVAAAVAQTTTGATARPLASRDLVVMGRLSPLQPRRRAEGVVGPVH